MHAGVGRGYGIATLVYWLFCHPNLAKVRLAQTVISIWLRSLEATRMNEKSQAFLRQIQTAIESDELILPMLPEVALQIREEIEHEDCSVNDIASILSQDAALSAHFIRIANSPLYRGIEEITDYRTVINRMGLSVVRDLVTSLALKQIFMATSEALDKEFRAAWSTSVNVAAISRTLAMHASGLSQEQALLAGLIHNIGILPVLVMVEKTDQYFEAAELEALINDLRGEVGKMVLGNWDFPEHLTDVVSESYIFDRHKEGPPDYVDLIQISLLQGGYAAVEDPGSVEAFAKLGIDPDIDFVNIEENKEEIDKISGALLG